MKPDVISVQGLSLTGSAMWTVLLVSIGLIPIGFLGLAIYASALIARPISEREHRSSSFSDRAPTTPKTGPAMRTMPVQSNPAAGRG